MRGGKGPGALALAVIAWLAPGYAAAAADGYTVWRRMMVDICQRLPTEAEVACITANAGALPSAGTCASDFANALDACFDGEVFAESIGRWVDDFTLPSRAPGQSVYHYIRWSEAEFAGATTIKYWYGPDWGDVGDCLDGVTTTSSAPADYLDKVYDPYWKDGAADPEAAGLYTDAGGTYVWVCRGTATITCDGVTAPVTASLADEDPGACGYACQRSTKLFPCGCGPNMRWCMLSSHLYDGDLTFTQAPHNYGAWWRYKEHALEESRRLVKHVVLEDRAGGLLGREAHFTEIFTAAYAIRTSRLQHFYEVIQNNVDDTDVDDACNRVIDAIDKTDCVSPAPALVTYDDYAPAGTSGRDVDAMGGDWQLIDFTGSSLAARMAGVLTTWQILNRQPSEPNLAGAVYRFWACDDVSWRGPGANFTNDWLFDSSAGSTLATEAWGTFPFSPLVRTTTAEDALTDSSCQGCHLTVNPLSSFRTFWDHVGRYQPSRYLGATAAGAFLGRTGSDLSGLGAILAGAEEVHVCIVQRSVERLTGSRLPTNSDTLADLTAVFRANGDMRELYRAILDTDEYRRPE